MSRAFNLFRLQQVDTRLDRARARLTEIEQLLTENAAVRQAQVELDEATSALEQAQKDLRSAEENTRSQRLKIEQTESHLYSGKVTNPKELQDLQNEVAALKRYRETLEERQLEAMLAFEEVEEVAAEAETRMTTLLAEKVEKDAGLLGEQSDLQAEVERLESERVVAEVSVTAEDRQTYARLQAKRGGVAVAQAAGGSCAACGSSLNTSLAQAARSPNKLVFCDTCGRVLYAG